MNIDIIIPSIKEENKALLSTIEKTRKSTGSIIHTGLNACAAKNRNFGLDKATSDIVIMMDDDITGFFEGWDEILCNPLASPNNPIYIISARLKKLSGEWSGMIGNVRDYETPVVYSSKKIVPSSCIAFYRDELRFDDSYLGSGYEDTDFCLQKKIKYPEGMVAINNECILVHLNEMKNQVDNVSINSAYFVKKWAITDLESFINDGDF